MGPVLNQFLTIISCNLLVLSCGATNSKLQKALWSALSEDVRDNETYNAIMIFNLIYYTTFVVGAFSIQFIHRIFGVKRTIQLLSIPLILGFILTNTFQPGLYFVTTMKLVFGFVYSSLFVSIPTLINDMSNDKNRGALCGLYELMSQIGLFIPSIVPMFSLQWIEISQVAIAIIGVISLILLPESTKQATRFRKRKYIAPTSDALSVKPEGVVEFGISSSVDESVESSSQPTTLKDFWTSQAKRAYLASIGSITLSYFFYTPFLRIFLEMPGYSGTISYDDLHLLYIVLTIVSSLIFLFIVDLINRKTLYIGSSILCALCFFLYGVCLMLNIQYQWPHIICYACVTIFATQGLRPIPQILACEIFPEKIQQTSLAIVVLVFMIHNYIDEFFYEVFRNSPLGNVIGFGSLCILNALFGKLFIPETRGKSHQQIMEILKK